MRIIAGARKGRALVAPDGQTTRPTSDRVRQALFDMLAHAPWGGHALLAGARVLDGFAGTGALALEALSRGAAEAVFFETDRAALSALRANIAACAMTAQVRVLPRDVRRPGVAPAPCGLVFLDPPYGQGLIETAWAALAQNGWIADGTIVVAECARAETLTCPGALLAEREHGAARISVWRHAVIKG